MSNYLQELFFGPTAAVLQAFVTVLGVAALLVLVLRWLFRAGGPLNR